MEVALEGLRAVRARRWRALSFGVAVGLVSGAAFAVSFADTTRIESQWTEQVYAGSNVLSITAAGAEGGSSLDAHRCDAMRSIGGVRSAGAIMYTYEVFAEASPSERFAVIEVTPGYLQVAYPRDPRVARASAVAGASVVERLGVVSGGVFAYRPRDQQQSFTVHVDVATSETARREPFDRAVMTAVGNPGSTYECMVEAQPGSIDAVASAAQMWFAPTEVKVVPELQNNTLIADPTTELRTRFSQWVPIVLGGALVIVVLMTWWSRRADYANYRAFGLTAPQMILLLTTETALTFWLPIVVGSSLACLALAPWISPVTARLLAGDYGTLLLTVSLTPMLGALLLGRRSAFEVAKGG